MFPDVQFIWKLQASEQDRAMLKDYPNVHVLDWVDQVSILGKLYRTKFRRSAAVSLAHPKTRAFVSHCGANSANEAATNGVPVVAVPLFADQLYNTAVIQRRGTGVYVDATKLSKQVVYEALRNVLTNPR